MVKGMWLRVEEVSAEVALLVLHLPSMAVSSSEAVPLMFLTEISSSSRISAALSLTLRMSVLLLRLKRLLKVRVTVSAAIS